MDIEIIRNDDASFEVTFTDVDGNVIDITGGTVFFTVKKRLSQSDADAVIAKSFTSFSDPDLGVAIIEIESNESNLPQGIYYYDIQLVLGGLVTSSQRGRLIVNQDVTLRTS